MPNFKIKNDIKMKNKLIIGCVALLMPAMMMLDSCSKLLDTHPVTQVVTKTDSTSISAQDAEDLINGVYSIFKGYSYGLEFNVLDRITNGDVRSDNCYAGGDNPDNITIDIFKANALNANIARDWKDAYGIIANDNLAIAQVGACTDPALSASRKNQILGEIKCMRAFTYFDLVRLFGRVPVMLKPVDQTNSETLISSVLVPQSSEDSTYDAILSDLWFAEKTVRNVGESNSKFTITKGVVDALLAKVYAAKPTPNWDSVAYYCDQVIPQYALLSNYKYLWDNQHKNSSEAIWELNYDGYATGDQVGNWIPSQFIGSGWKKFETPSNDLVNDFMSEGDSVRMKASITFVDYGWDDAYWKDKSHYPIVTKYTDPDNGTNDFYLIRLPDILLLKAEALVQKGDIAGALVLVNKVRARVKLAPKTAASADDANAIIANERRLELAFEGKRWFDLVRTGKAIEVMNAQKDGNGNNLNYNVQPYQLVYPIPQTQLDLNPLLTQNPGY